MEIEIDKNRIVLNRARQFIEFRKEFERSVKVDDESFSRLMKTIKTDIPNLPPKIKKMLEAAKEVEVELGKITLEINANTRPNFESTVKITTLCEQLMDDTVEIVKEYDAKGADEYENGVGSFRNKIEKSKVKLASAEPKDVGIFLFRYAEFSRNHVLRSIEMLMRPDEKETMEKLAKIFSKRVGRRKAPEEEEEETRREH